MSLWVRLPSGSATRLAVELQRQGVLVAPGPVFTVEGGSDSWLRIPFAKPEDELVAAVRLMAELWPAMIDAQKTTEVAHTLIA